MFKIKKLVEEDDTKSIELILEKYKTYSVIRKLVTSINSNLIFSVKSYNMAKLLIDNGFIDVNNSDINILNEKSTQKHSPLSYMCFEVLENPENIDNEKEKIISLLIEKGADKNFIVLTCDLFSGIPTKQSSILCNISSINNVNITNYFKIFMLLFNGGNISKNKIESEIIHKNLKYIQANNFEDILKNFLRRQNISKEEIIMIREIIKTSFLYGIEFKKEFLNNEERLYVYHHLEANREKKQDEYIKELEEILNFRKDYSSLSSTCKNIYSKSDNQSESAYFERLPQHIRRQISKSLSLGCNEENIRTIINLSDMKFTSILNRQKLKNREVCIIL